jgi:hypothetical protein
MSQQPPFAFLSVSQSPGGKTKGSLCLDGAGASRRVIKSQQDDKVGSSSKLIEVSAPACPAMWMSFGYPELPAVDARLYFEVVSKPRKGLPEVTQTFTHRVDAEQAYEIACHGVTDRTTKLLDLPRAFWNGKRELAVVQP